MKCPGCSTELGEAIVCGRGRGGGPATVDRAYVDAFSLELHRRNGCSFDAAVARGEAAARVEQEKAVVEIEDLIVHLESEGDPREAARLGMARAALEALHRALAKPARQPGTPSSSP